MQDSWTINRLTVNGGLRVENFRAQISDQDVGAGRFVAARHWDKTPCMPCWTDFAPRFGVSYDLFGNARTALKATFNKYMAGQTLGYAQRYNPLRIQADTRTWRDTNGDNIAQENEIGPSNNLTFGLPVFSVASRSGRPAPRVRSRDERRHPARAVRGLSVSGSWFRRTTHNERRTDNLLVGISDYATVQVVSPLDGRGVHRLQPEPRQARPGRFGRLQLDRYGDSARASTTASSSGCPAGCAARRSSAAGRSIG